MSDEHRMGNQPPLDVPPEHPEHWIDKLRRASGYTDAECIADLRKMLKTERDEVDRLRAEVQQIEANEIAHAEANEVLVTRVAKLEAENAALKQSTAAAHRKYEEVNVERNLTVAKLEAENAALKENAWAALYHEALKLKRENLHLKELSITTGAENAELREDAKLNWSAVKAQRDRAEAENATLKARLAWFEKRECEHDRLFRDGCSIAYIHAHMKQWMDANPKPSEGT